MKGLVKKIYVHHFIKELLERNSLQEFPHYVKGSWVLSDDAQKEFKGVYFVKVFISRPLTLTKRTTNEIKDDANTGSYIYFT